MASNGSAWAVVDVHEGAYGVVSRVDGTEWSELPVPGDGETWIASVQARSADDVWAVGERDDQPYAAHWDGTSWRNAAPDEVTPPDGDDEFAAYLTDVAVVDGVPWAVGIAAGDVETEGLLYRFDGSAWQRRPRATGRR